MKEKIEMVVFDWAGTTVDYGSMAPVTVFENIFNRENISLSKEQINKPMGLDKKVHIRSLLQMPEVGQAWKDEKGRDWTEDDVESLYQNFEEELEKVVAEYSKPIDGVVETVEKLRDQGIKIGSTTGYTTDMMENVKYKAADLGYKPDCLITPDIAGAGRPSPYMVFEAMKALGVYSTNSVVKVGDTISDIEEGINAGVWTIGILEGSNLLGLTEEEYKNTPQEEIEELKEQAAEKYFRAGADFVINDITKLVDLIDHINETFLSEEDPIDITEKKTNFLIQ